MEVAQADLPYNPVSKLHVLAIVLVVVSGEGGGDTYTHSLRILLMVTFVMQFFHTHLYGNNSRNST